MISFATGPCLCISAFLLRKRLYVQEKLKSVQSGKGEGNSLTNLDVKRNPTDSIENLLSRVNDSGSVSRNLEEATETYEKSSKSGAKLHQSLNTNRRADWKYSSMKSPLSNTITIRISWPTITYAWNRKLCVNRTHKLQYSHHRVADHDQMSRCAVRTNWLSRCAVRSLRWAWGRKRKADADLGFQWGCAWCTCAAVRKTRVWVFESLREWNNEWWI